MKHLNYLFSLALILLGFGWASADVVENYTCDFNTSITTGSSNRAFKVAPGWKHIVGCDTTGSSWRPTYSYVDYAYGSTYGVDGTGALYAYTQTNHLDYLVTPPVTGSFTLQAKLNVNGYIKFFAINKDAEGNLVPAEEPLFEKAYTSEEGSVWAEVTQSGLNAQMIGIVIQNTYIDNFVVTGSAEIIYEPKLSITRSGSTSWVYPYVNADNQFTYDVPTVTVTNIGERDLVAGEDNFSISIAPQNKPDEAVLTVPISVNLAIGESTTIEGVSVTETYNTSWVDANGRKRMDIYEDFGKTSVVGNWIQPKPYVPEMTVKQGTNDLSQTSYATAFGTFGMINENVVKTFTINSTGGAPLEGTVTLDVNGGFSVSQNAFNLAAGESMNVDVTALSSTPGVFSGTLTVAATGVESVIIPLSATVLDENKFFEPFTNDANMTTIPAGWYAPTGNWTKTSNTNGSNNYVKSGVIAPHKLITPLLRVAEGEKMTFDASRQTNSGLSERFINVYYSTDRENWTLVKEVPSADLPALATGYNASPTNFATIVVEGVPAGEYYIAFESGYCFIDNVYGFERVDVNHDVVVTDFQIPGTVTSNNDVTATVTLLNLNSVAEANYTSTLKLDGQIVADADPVEIAPNASVTIEFTFVPNNVGTFPAVAEFNFGDDYIVTTTETEVEVKQETAEDVIQVGEPSSTTNSVPLSLSYNNSESETVYTAEQLGIEPGTMITSITYKGYVSISKTLTPTVSIYLANAEEATLVTPTTGSQPLMSTEGMTKVFEEDVTFATTGSTTQHEPLISATLAEPFEYTGGALRIVVRALYDDWASGVNFETASVAGQSLYRRNDTQTTFLEGNSYVSSANMPVVYLGIEKEATTYSGVVTDTKGQPIEGVTVTLTSIPANAEGGPRRAATSGSAVYTATTDAEGKFTVNVIQSDLRYNANFAKEGYKAVNVDGIDFANGNVTLDQPIVMELDSTTGVADINGKTIQSVKFYNVAGQAADKAFEGINIVVTTYTDGTTSTVKMVK